MRKPPYKLWRLKHRLKAAYRNDEVFTWMHLEQLYAKTKRLIEVKAQ